MSAQDRPVAKGRSFDRFRDPKGWLLDKLPWPLRRLYVSWQYREWVPNGARYMGLRRPPLEAFEVGRQLARESSDTVVHAAAAAWDEREWNERYDEAMQWRDWQTCEILMDEREQAYWWTERERDDA